MPTLANVEMIGSVAKMVEKLGAAKTVVNKATWPATVRRTDRHLQEENVENRDQARLEEIRVATVRDRFVPPPRTENGPRRPKKHLRRPGGRRPREELNSAISTKKPEKN